MKIKFLLATTVAACLIGSAAANAQLSVQIGAPPVVVQPAPVYPVYPAYPVYYAPPPAVIVHPWVEGYDPYHRANDWRYWQERRRHEGHERAHEEWRHDHR